MQGSAIRVLGKVSVLLALTGVVAFVVFGVSARVVHKCYVAFWGSMLFLGFETMSLLLGLVCIRGRHGKAGAITSFACIVLFLSLVWVVSNHADLRIAEVSREIGVRTRPNLDSRVICTLHHGEKVIVLDSADVEGTPWYFIETPKCLFGQYWHGWVPSASLVTRGKVRHEIAVRAKANRDAQQIATLHKGETVTILDRGPNRGKIVDPEDYWYRVETPRCIAGQSMEGWVHGTDLITVDDNFKR